MTVVIGLPCANGGILASDSQATDIEAAVKHEVESKIYPLGSHIAWGASGQIGIHQVLQVSLDKAIKHTWPKKSLSQIRMPIVDKVTGRQKEAISQYVPILETILKTAVPTLKELVDNAPKAEVLLCGYTQDNWLLEIAESGQHQQHHKFCAIGSGKITAYRVWSALRHYTPHDDSVELGKFLAHRIVHDVITTDAQGVGFPIKMWVIMKDGVTELGQTEIDAQAFTIDRWKKEERRSLRRVLEGKSEAT